MCEHEFDKLKNIAEEIIEYRKDLGRKVTPKKDYSHLIDCIAMVNWVDVLNALQQLAAANARVASLEKQNADLFPYYQDHLEGALIPATEYQQWIKRAEQAEAQCAATRLHFEHYVRNNCPMIERLKSTIGIPDLEEGKCQGYTVSSYDDEPADRCKGCVAAFHDDDDEKPDAGTAILADNKRMREALIEISCANGPRIDCLQRIAKAALEGKA